MACRRPSFRGHWRKRVPLLAAVLLLAVPAQAPAALTVKGKLAGARGATVLGVSEDGSAVAKRIRGNKRFKLRFTGMSGRAASIQLISRSGSYAGPVVIARTKRKAYTAFSGRGKRINLKKVRVRRGYGTVRRGVSRRLLEERAVDRGLWARANSRGKPVGAGKLGLVETRGRAAARGAGAAGPLPGTDSDADGLPNLADADDNGNGVIDQSDPEAPPAEAGARATVFSTLPLEPEQALNANAAGVTEAQIDATLREHLRLGLLFFPEGRADAVDVDCFALSYCRQGSGTALTTLDGLAPGADGAPPPDSPWVDYDPNGNGLPNLVFTDSVGGGPPGFHLVVTPRATTAQIQPGDSYNFVATDGAGPVNVPLTLATYFVTTPAITVWDDGGEPQAVSYPVQPGDPGTSENPAALISESVRLTWWRPQRPAIPGAEQGELIDMGGLIYGVDVSVRVGDGDRVVQCIPDDWSNPSATLEIGSPFPGPPGQESLTDSAADAPPDSANTLAATLDLGGCLRREGIDPAGKVALARIIATTQSRDGAGQFFHMRLPG